jgi:hypothetical protein
VCVCVCVCVCAARMTSATSTPGKLPRAADTGATECQCLVGVIPLQCHVRGVEEVIAPRKGDRVDVAFSEQIDEVFYLGHGEHTVTSVANSCRHTYTGLSTNLVWIRRSVVMCVKHLQRRDHVPGMLLRMIPHARAAKGVEMEA